MDKDRIEIDINDLNDDVPVSQKENYVNENMNDQSVIYNKLNKISENEKIIITNDDLKDVDDKSTYNDSQLANRLIMQKEMKSKGGISSNTISTMVGGLIGGILAFIVSELLFLNEGANYNAVTVILHMATYFAIIGFFIGASLGSVEGITTRNFEKTLKDLAIGFTIGIIGGFLAGAIAQVVYGILIKSLYTSRANNPFVLQVLIRALGWGIAGLIFGLGYAIPGCIGKKIVNGLLGGLIGGTIGGLLFDPISVVLNNSAILSRAVGIVIIGGSIGAAIGLIEDLRKEAWLKTVHGKMKGKEFIIYKEKTLLGSIGKCDIVLLKDPGVAPNHAVIIQQKNNYYLQDLNTIKGSYVNDQRISNRMLKNGDMIRVGDNIFIYYEKAIKNK